MCGIFGWSVRNGADRTPLRTIGAVLAESNDERGGHSWGVFADGKTKKGIGNMGRAGAKLGKLMAGADTLMAHTRFATTGACTVANAHPFKIGGIVGAHNGIVFNHEELNRDYGRACAVDSMHLFHHLADSLPMDDIQAYGAIEWVDMEGPTAVNLARFHGGELTVAKTDFGIIWSSDWLHLDAALKWAGLDYLEFDIREGRIYSAREGKLYDLAPIDIGRRPATKWPVKWDDAKHSAGKTSGKADRLPSQEDIDAAWDEWEQRREDLEEIEMDEQIRIDTEERELLQELNASLARDFD